MFEAMRNLLFAIGAVPAVLMLAMTGLVQFVIVRGFWINAHVWLEVLCRG